MMKLGVDKFLESDSLRTFNRIGVLVHAASISSTGEHLIDAIKTRAPGRLKKIFTPEHGLFGNAQDMVGVEGSAQQGGAIPVISLYGDGIESLWPEVGALRDLDVLIVDLQDVGTRYYTYIYTMGFCMVRARLAGIPVIVCDRPNPIGGVKIEGKPQQREYCSFVGWYPLPVRHGKTIGELARHFNDAEGIGCDLTVIEMEGWDRAQLGLAGKSWVNPSPNMPSLAAALTYPGTCLIEGTNLSEGRGTTRPFEWIGAPYIDSKTWISALGDIDLPGVSFIPWAFEPMFQKWKGQICHGVQLIIDDPDAFLPYRTGCAMIATAQTLWPQAFKWRTETYEFVSDRLAIDLLTGSTRFREGVERGDSFDTIMVDIA